MQDLKDLPLNSLVCSTKGKGITALAGGDTDGDTVFVTLNPDVVSFLEATQPAVDALDLAPIAYAKRLIEKKTPTGFAVNRAKEYVAYAAAAPTLNVRGMATSMAEKCQQVPIFLSSFFSRTRSRAEN